MGKCHTKPEEKSISNNELRNYRDGRISRQKEENRYYNNCDQLKKHAYHGKRNGK